MLLITRKAGESVIIGSDIKVTVMKVKGPQVKIGIEAPRQMTVHRQEVHDRIGRIKKDEDGRPPSDDQFG